MLPNHDADGGGAEHLNEHVCLDLLLGIIPGDREAALLEHLGRCPDCETRFQDLAAREAHLEARRVLGRSGDGTLRQERRGTPAASDPETPAKPDAGIEERRPVSFWRSGSFAAAGLAAAAIVLLLLLPQSGDRSGLLEARPLPTYAVELEARDAATEPVSAQLAMALTAYDAGKAERAAELLRDTAADELSELDRVIRSLYLGSALALSGRHEEAVSALDAAPLFLLPGEWGGEAQWTLFVALSNSGETARADSLLALLAERPGELGERARRVIRQR